MVFLIVNWVAGTFALLALASILPGFRVSDFQSVLLATGVVGLISAAIAMVFRQMYAVAALSISAALLIVVDTLVFRVTALLVPGFAMRAFYPAAAGALVLVAVHLMLLRAARARDESVQSQSVMQL